MKNQKWRNLLIGFMLLCISSAQLGCDEVSSSDISRATDLIKDTAAYESTANESEITGIQTPSESSIASVALQSSVASPPVMASQAVSSSRVSSVGSPSSEAASSTSVASEAAKPGPTPLTTPKKRMATNGMGAFACLDDSGKLYVWGNSNLRNFPVDLPPLIDVALGQDFGVGLDASGKLHAWGDLGQNDHGQTNFGDNLPAFVEVEASAYHTAAISADGRIYKWGSGNNGDQKYVPSTLGKVKSVAVDAYVTAVVTSEDKVVRWGVSPRNVFSSTYSMVSCSHYDVFALGKDGKVYGTFTSLDGNSVAIQPPTASNIVKISGTLALDSNGKVFGWGANQLYKHDEMADVPTNLPRIIDITGSGMNGMALGENGKIYTWGFGVETASHPAYDFISSEPNVYADEPAPVSSESVSVKSYAELQAAVVNPVCRTITIEGNVVITVNSIRIEKDLIVPKGSSLIIESSAGNVMIYGKLTVDGSVVVRGRIMMVRDTDISVTGSIIKQANGKVSIYMNDPAQFENLLKSEVFNDILYTPGTATFFTIDRDITIPSGKSVWLNVFVTVKVTAGSTLTVNGTVQTYNTPVVEGKVVGTITVQAKA